jgi:hypothetical protein
VLLGCHQASDEPDLRLAALIGPGLQCAQPAALMSSCVATSFKFKFGVMWVGACGMSACMWDARIHVG